MSKDGIAALNLFLTELTPTIRYSMLDVRCWTIISFVGWVEPTSGFVEFRYTQPKLHFIGVLKMRNPTPDFGAKP